MSVYGLKLRRTDPSDSVVSMSTYAVSSGRRQSMFRRQRLTMRVLASGSHSKPPNEVYICALVVEHGTAGIAYREYPFPACVTPGPGSTTVTGTTHG